MWLVQAKKLLKLLGANFTSFVNTMMRVRLPKKIISEKEFIQTMEIDLSFIDKILQNMVGMTPQYLTQLLNQNDENYL